MPITTRRKLAQKLFCILYHKNCGVVGERRQAALGKKQATAGCIRGVRTIVTVTRRKASTNKQRFLIRPPRIGGYALNLSI
jgi:hypothetical protein